MDETVGSGQSIRGGAATRILPGTVIVVLSRAARTADAQPDRRRLSEPTPAS
ncbi:MAG: hypothetical protein ACXWK4_07270 [Myxococcaceae bacterium]